MKTKLALFFLFVINFYSFAQAGKFDDIIRNDSKSFTFYSNAYFNPAKKECSDLYVECKFDANSFVFEDTLKAFYPNKKLCAKVYFSKGMRNGRFFSYYKNGKIATEGQYTDDQREGVWKDYYENGSIHKVVDYAKNGIVLLEFYTKKGEQLVVNGEGYFKDEVVNALGNKYKFEGTIVDGTMDGEWQSYIDKKLIGTETFRNKAFIKGSSFSVIGVENYTDKFYSTFLDAVFLENIGFRTVRTKCEDFGITVNFTKFKDLKDGLKKNYALLRNDMPKDYWFFAGLLFDGYSLKNVTIFSPDTNIDKVKLAEFVKKSYIFTDFALEMRDSRSLLPMVVVNGELFLQGDTEIPLLSN